MASFDRVISKAICSVRGCTRRSVPVIRSACQAFSGAAASPGGLGPPLIILPPWNANLARSWWSSLTVFSPHSPTAQWECIMAYYCFGRVVSWCNRRSMTRWDTLLGQVPILIVSPSSSKVSSKLAQFHNAGKRSNPSHYRANVASLPTTMGYLCGWQAWRLI